MGEVPEFEAGRETPSPERRDDIQEVLNDRSAMRRAERGCKTCHFPSGPSGPRTKCCSPACAIDAAAFVPTGADRLVDAMSAWERDIHHDAP